MASVPKLSQCLGSIAFYPITVRLQEDSGSVFAIPSRWVIVDSSKVFP